jgi:hypothetical protein
METFEMDEPGLSRFYGTLDKNTSVIIEATINTFAFVALFEHLADKVVIANTYQLKEAGPKQKKTDKIDAFKMSIRIWLSPKASKPSELIAMQLTKK